MLENMELSLPIFINNDDYYISSLFHLPLLYQQEQLTTLCLVRALP